MTFFYVVLHAILILTSENVSDDASGANGRCNFSTDPVISNDGVVDKIKVDSGDLNGISKNS